MMVIDNSISMYTYKQLEDKGYSVSGAEGNDSTFKRLTLTNKLIDMFTGNYHFGIAEFAGYYVNLNKFTDNKETSKNSVESIKYDIDNVGDGTNIVNALNKGISEFSKDEDNHYLILLTDGKDTNEYTTLANSKKSIISSAKEKDIKVCVIGLGSKIDSEDLDEIAEGTGCDYYNANDANALDEIYALIAADINYNLVDTNKDGIVDSTVIADSGFIVTRDGFSFNNYASSLSGGHCYGMALFAELYYTKKLPMNFGARKTTRENENLDLYFEMNSYAYDLYSTYFYSYSNLYDYKLKTNSLKHLFGYEHFGEETPKNLYSIKDSLLVYDEDIKNEALNSGLYDLITAESHLSKERRIEKHGAYYENYEDLVLNEDKMQSSSILDNNDKQLLNALSSFLIKQLDTDFYSSSFSFENWVFDKLTDQNFDRIHSAAFIELLKSRIESGDAPVIGGDFDGGDHAINAISLAQHIDNPNHYSIGVYDNNYPGEKRYVDIVCNKLVCVTKEGAYYSNSNKAINISKSLDDDLAYFKN